MEEPSRTTGLLRLPVLCSWTFLFRYEMELVVFLRIIMSGLPFDSSINDGGPLDLNDADSACRAVELLSAVSELGRW